jgi:hypothetical protein
MGRTLAVLHPPRRRMRTPRVRITPNKVARDSNLDINEMGGGWGGLVPGLVDPS